jgi:hypothetical protein
LTFDEDHAEVDRELLGALDGVGAQHHQQLATDPRADARNAAEQL